MTKTQYRSANIIIQTILEGIIRAERENSVLKGIVKHHLTKYSGLKTPTAEKYFAKLEKANYIEKHEEKWGERDIIVYTITALGRERHDWFVKINTEIE